MARMIGPHRNNGINFGGVAYEPDGEGCITVPNEAIEAARYHGFVLTEHQPDDVADPAAEPEVRHMGFGRWAVVDQRGKPLTDSTRSRAEAEAKLAEIIEKMTAPEPAAAHA